LEYHQSIARNLSALKVLVVVSLVHVNEIMAAPGRGKKTGKFVVGPVPRGSKRGEHTLTQKRT
jgi:hypothetical protein